MLRFLILLAALLALVGCSTRVEVQSNARWSKYVGGSRTLGEGNAVFQVSRDDCFTFTKDDSAGFLRARVVRGRRAEDWHETAAPFGSVTVCTN